MFFGDIPLAEAEGAILAHSVRVPGLALKKGQKLAPEQIKALAKAGIETVIAARLDAGDVGEDEAAARLAEALAGPNLRCEKPHTGRVNLFATADGVLRIDRDRIDAINRVDEAITAATLEAFAPVRDGQMVATIKIIPLSAPGEALAACEAIAKPDGQADCLQLAPYRARRVGLVQTRVSGTKESVLDKTRRVTDERLAAMGMKVADERRCPHEAEAVLAEIRALLDGGVELLLLIGASAIIDRRDVLPAAVAAAGGEIERFGMPVDPGNLMMLARIGAVQVLGLPGCARSKKLNGFDWVLQRIAADIPVMGADVTGMGVGGLLTEIPSRPQPRIDPVKESEAEMPNIAAIVLAAGQSRRMGPQNKLLAPLDGTPMVALAVAAATGSKAKETIVVTGHDGAKVRAALAGFDVRFVHCADASGGLSHTLRAGLAALGPEVSAAVICLGDMPYVSADGINALIGAYEPDRGHTIAVTTYEGKRGNPVLWDRRYFAEMADISGDVGARHLIGTYDEAVREVAADDARRLVDIDTPEALATARMEKSA